MKTLRHKNPINQERWERFRSIKRAWWSLWILGVAYLLSLTSPWLVNDKPLIVKYGEELFFPAFKFYPETAFGGQYRTEADYTSLIESEAFARGGGEVVLMPPIPHNPLRPNLEMEGNPPHPPSARHWLGTDTSGRDVLARIIHGFRIAMTFALIVTVFAAALGLVIGGLQGYFGGWTDLLWQRGIEVWGSLPLLYVVILIGDIYGRSVILLAAAMAAFEWIGLSYYTRGEFFKVKAQAFVAASKSLGAGHFRLFFKQMLPNCLGPAITILPFTLVSAIGALTALDFLGFGLMPPTPSWGELMNQGLDNLYAPWLAFSAVAALFITLLLATFIGEGVRAAFDPKSSAKLR